MAFKYSIFLYLTAYLRSARDITWNPEPFYITDITKFQDVLDFYLLGLGLSLLLEVLLVFTVVISLILNITYVKLMDLPYFLLL
jgi:hypothetical protein